MLKNQEALTTYGKPLADLPHGMHGAKYGFHSVLAEIGIDFCVKAAMGVSIKI
ncbi:hypothetical protein AB1K70_10060 [Bremerella sp. JC770]|uniref:hypothetical protein n=1 Tax=Bremerella sp. JC770 TaxID=3232137 RepID=UPI00345AEBD9